MKVSRMEDVVNGTVTQSTWQSYDNGCTDDVVSKCQVRGLDHGDNISILSTKSFPVSTVKVRLKLFYKCQGDLEVIIESSN